jgi:hypothetical protein
VKSIRPRPEPLVRGLRADAERMPNVSPRRVVHLAGSHDFDARQTVRTLGQLRRQHRTVEVVGRRARQIVEELSNLAVNFGRTWHER